MQNKKKKEEASKKKINAAKRTILA